MPRRGPNFYAVLAELLPLFASALLLGCGGGDARSDGPRRAEGPLYAINTRVHADDFANPSSYIALVDDLEAGRAALGDAVELPGAGSLWGVPLSGQLYVISAEQRTVTQFRLDSAGRLQQGERLGLDVSQLVTEAIAFDGPERGFLFDMISAQAIEIDLEKMVIEDRHDISALRIDSAEITFLGEGGFRRRGDELVGVVYGSSAAYDRVALRSKVGFFDPGSGSLEVVEAPCGGLNYSFETQTGDWYFSTDPWVAGIHALDESRAPAPCMARLPAGSHSFDSSVIALNEVTGGVTGGAIPSSDGTVYVRVLDQSVFPLTPDTDLLEPFSVPAWTTWSIALPGAESASPVARPLIAGGIKFVRVDERVYQNESSADFASTTLVRTTGSDAPKAGLEVPGVPWNVVRVR